MFKNFTVPATLMMIAAVAVAASVIPRSGLIEDRETKAADAASYVRNNLYLGKKSDSDILLRTDTITVKGFRDIANNATVTFSGNFILTYVQAIDLDDSTLIGAHPTLLSGGPGHRSITLLFTSKAGGPINFRVSYFVQFDKV